MSIKVTHYSGDRFGGAGRAAQRLHSAFRKSQNFESNMIVLDKKDDDFTINCYKEGFTGRLEVMIKSSLDLLPRRLSSSLDNMPRSAGWSTLLTAKDVNLNPSDVAHLHWINGGFLSIEEIGKINKPLVWTLHDMWPFCGAEHLTSDRSDARWRVGYPPSPNVSGFDFDRWVWKRKKVSWQKPISIVAPSRWIAECARQSSIMRDFPICVIPNTLDVEVYKPMDKMVARNHLNLPQNKKLILFGAFKGTQLPYKGWDLLMPALADVFEEYKDVEGIIFGQSMPEKSPALKIPLHWMGHIYDDFTLAALYSAADILVIPSRQESFGQTGSEAQACGCPVIAFDTTGLKDVVENNKTGILVKPFESTALASAIVLLLKNDELRNDYSIAARSRAQERWSYSVVSKQYKSVYEEVIDA